MACLWLATKVEEFNVSITQFVDNLKENPAQSRRSEDLILALELPIISALKVCNIRMGNIEQHEFRYIFSKVFVR